MLSLSGAIWNLILAFIPFGAVCIIEKKISATSWKNLSSLKKFGLYFLLGVCVAFFPNIPYIFTDVRHIMDHCSGDDLLKRCLEAAWAIPVLFTYSALAIPLFVITIRKMSTIFSRIIHPVFQKITPYIIIPLSALGICLGLFERFNSWDVAMRGRYVFEIAILYAVHREKFFIWMTISACLFVIFYIFDALLCRKS